MTSADGLSNMFGQGLKGRLGLFFDSLERPSWVRGTESLLETVIIAPL